MKNKFLILCLYIVLVGCETGKLVELEDPLFRELGKDNVDVQEATKHEKPEDLSQVKIGNQIFHTEVSDSPETHKVGLMFREYLAPETGMLFVFEESSYRAFWMKNTYIPLDVVWISEQKMVVDVQTLLPCNVEQCPVFDPKEKAMYVLEVNAGEFQGKVGDKVEF